MKLQRSFIERYESGRSTRSERPQAGVSLHSHSNRSRERLNFIPGVAHKIPLVSRLFDRSVMQFGRAIGHPLDFESVYWRPPSTPEGVIASERQQIADRLDCAALVALTDHDTFDGPQSLRNAGMTDVPLSVEWSVNVHDAVLHLGVHALPQSRLAEASRLLGPAHESTRPDVAMLLDWLVETPETFIILNHPFWDFANIGALHHETVLLSFLRSFGDRLHGLELNGYRRWSENRRVVALAEAFELPVVGGGDRHGHAPNAIVNATDATSFPEFAYDLRRGKAPRTIIFPEYFEPFAARVFQGFREALRPDMGTGSCAWGERVFFVADGVEYSIATVWPQGGPLWLRGGFELTRLLGAEPLRPLFRLTHSGEQITV